jgi:hypothetical protein
MLKIGALFMAVKHVIFGGKSDKNSKNMPTEPLILE